jgi:dUTP pyrophosphatase
MINSSIKVKITKITENAKIPERAYSTDSGLDLYSSIDIEIPSKEIRLIPTGIAIELPESIYTYKAVEAQVRSKSGLALNHGIMVLNSPGTIDNSYRGEIKVIVMNVSEDSFFVTQGSKIAQLVLTEVLLPQIIEVDALRQGLRDKNGFGSTGI